MSSLSRTIPLLVNGKQRRLVPYPAREIGQKPFELF